MVDDMQADPVKMFRAPKTTRNRDDFRVLLAGSIMTILIMLLVPTITKVMEVNFAQRPFVTATVEIYQSSAFAKPSLLYDADANRTVEATWIAVIRDANDLRLNTRRGKGNYSVREDNPRPWTWEAFFNTEDGTPVPAVPDVPFRICLSYVALTLGTLVSDESPEYCSDIFYPGNLKD